MQALALVGREDGPRSRDDSGFLSKNGEVPYEATLGGDLQHGASQVRVGAERWGAPA